MEGVQQEGYNRTKTVSLGDPTKYGGQYGILTFRGGPLRQNAAFGSFMPDADALEAEQSGKELSAKLTQGRVSRTIRLADGSTGFAFGSQPVIVKWPKVIREMMNIYSRYVVTGEGASPMKEVIIPSSDGNIYFFDLESQQPSRDAISVGMSLDTTASISPYGYPLLYVGQTKNKMTVYYSENKKELNDNQKSTKQSVEGNIGLRIYSLIDQSLAGFESTLNAQAVYPGNVALYSSPILIVDRDTHENTAVYAASSGLVYTVDDHVSFDMENRSISVSPVDTTYGYTLKYRNDPKQGVWASAAVYGDYAFIGDMNGALQCIDLNSMSCVWIRDMGDSIVATPALEVEDDLHVWLYTGTVLNKGKKSQAVHMIKLNALNGELVWERTTDLKGVFASKTAKQGLYAGVQASPLIGSGDIDDLVIFNVNRLQVEKKLTSAVVYALDKTTGEPQWEQILDAESISSPIAVYRRDTGKSYLILGDDNGTLRVMDGYTGLTLDSLQLSGPIQASPAAYDNHIVVGTTNGLVVFADLELKP